MNGVFWDVTPCGFCKNPRFGGTELALYITRKIWGLHGGDYEERRLLGCDAVWVSLEQMFRRNLAPPWSGWQKSAN
jgi:hypothetical protein